MRYGFVLIGFSGVLGCSAACPPRAFAGPLVLAQAEGGGIGGSLAAPETRTVRAKPRPRRIAAPRAAPAPRVIVKREVVYEPRYVTRPAAPAPRRSVRQSDGLASYDGVWAVSAGGPCSGAGSGQAMISAGRITSSTGSGTISSGGAVNTVSALNGITIVAQGQMTGRSGSGVYRQSDGCTATWSAVKL